LATAPPSLAIPAAVLASVLMQNTRDATAGPAVVPAAAVARALAQASALTVPTGPAVPIADIERVLASAAPATSAGVTMPPPSWPALPSMPASGPAPVLPQRAPLATAQAAQAATATISWPPAPIQDTVSVAGESIEPVTPGELTSLTEMLTKQIGDEPPRNWVDMDNTGHLDQLTAKIYDRLNDRLRRDVLVQRERSGKLMDPW
jgi:hypothetical protein